MRRRSKLILAFALSLITTACTEARMMTKPMNTPKIDKLFEKTKPVCFGRFVIDVPIDTNVVPGQQDLGASIKTSIDGHTDTHKAAAARRAQLLSTEQDRPEITAFETTSRTDGSATQLNYWRSKNARAVGLEDIEGFVRSGSVLFSVHLMTGDNDSPESMRKRYLQITTHLRARSSEEIPTEPGVCLDLGFIADDTGKYQEIFGIGFRFPSLPDVSLSISSNKDGQTPEPLSKRRKQAEKLALDSPFSAAFSKVKVMRDGERRIAQWDGEEALFRRPREERGVWHELRFNYPGIRYDHRNPRLDATLFTGVERNTAGALESSLSDEETIALWDRMLSTLRLRVPAR